MFATFESNLDGRLMGLDLPSEARQQLEEEKINLAAVEVPEGLEAELTTTVERAVDEAFVSGYRVVMLAAATLALASALSAALLIESKKKGARGASAETMTSASSSRLDAEHPAEIHKR
jgi:hypothetical protein